MKRGKTGRHSGRGVNVLYQNIPFVFFLVGLGLIYIANSHYAEKKVRQIEKLKTELVGEDEVINTEIRDHAWQHAERVVEESGDVWLADPGGFAETHCRGGHTQIGDYGY